MQSAMQKLVCLAVLKKCANASLCRCSVEMKVNLYEYSRSAKMQERPLEENEMCVQEAVWEERAGLQNAFAPEERESNIKKGCKMA